MESEIHTLNLVNEVRHWRREKVACDAYRIKKKSSETQGLVELPV